MFRRPKNPIETLDSGEYPRDNGADRLNAAFIDGKLPISDSHQRDNPVVLELERQAALARGVC